MLLDHRKSQGIRKALTRAARLGATRANDVPCSTHALNTFEVDLQSGPFVLRQTDIFVKNAIQGF